MKKTYIDNISMKDKLEIVRNKCKLIVDIGFDYDGYGNSLDGCKSLIDEFVRYSNDNIKLIDSILKEIK